MPVLPNPQLSSSRATPNEQKLKRFDAAVVLHDVEGDLGASGLPMAKTLAALASRNPKATQLTTMLPGNKATRLIAARVSTTANTFDRDTAVRKAAVAALQDGARQIAVVIHGPSFDPHGAIARSIVMALGVADFKLPKFTKTRPTKTATLKITVFETSKTQQKQTLAIARGNSLARWLTAMPPNLLDAIGYRTVIERLAKRYRWQYKFHSASALKRRGAGAFTAVAQGNEHNHAGVVQLTHKARAGKKGRAHIALVGKGIIFDTGGTNLKPFEGMLKMHIDMGGSAVALGALLALCEADADMDIDVWLAITENRTGPSAYKSQDVVTALNGKTIQTIHTDAEGRMVLADTLTLAAQRKPQMILDFATLTGACMGAITTRYSGVFTNRRALHPLLKRAGVATGERVWPFPIGGEFLEALKSETADLQQCSPGGGGDHILAATFLAEFVPSSIPWIHIDLSACEHKGGLGVVPTDITGFGVRYATETLLEHHRDIARAKNSG